jgi:hypothetical protein
MRLMALAFLVALALIVDQLRTGGYYRTQTMNGIEQGARSIIRIFS